jgi:hypothetical protein
MYDGDTVMTCSLWGRLSDFKIIPTDVDETPDAALEYLCDAYEESAGAARRRGGPTFRYTILLISLAYSYGYVRSLYFVTVTPEARLGYIWDAYQ